jgi:hypothetical protein
MKKGVAKENILSFLQLTVSGRLFLPDMRPARYPATPKAGYRISSRILDKYIFGKISNKFK